MNYFPFGRATIDFSARGWASWTQKHTVTRVRFRVVAQTVSFKFRWIRANTCMLASVTWSFKSESHWESICWYCAKQTKRTASVVVKSWLVYCCLHSKSVQTIYAHRPVLPLCLIFDVSECCVYRRTWIHATILYTQSAYDNVVIAVIAVHASSWNFGADSISVQVT